MRNYRDALHKIIVKQYKIFEVQNLPEHKVVYHIEKEKDMTKSKSLAAHYAHVHNGGIEFEIKKLTDDFSQSHIRLHTQVSNFGCYTDTSVPLDATAAKWLIKSLTDLMPELEKAQSISDIEDEDLYQILSEDSVDSVADGKNDLMNAFRAADDVAPVFNAYKDLVDNHTTPNDGALKNGQAIPGGSFIKTGKTESGQYNLEELAFDLAKNLSKQGAEYFFEELRYRLGQANADDSPYDPEESEEMFEFNSGKMVKQVAQIQSTFDKEPEWRLW